MNTSACRVIISVALSGTLASQHIPKRKGTFARKLIVSVHVEMLGSSPKALSDLHGRSALRDQIEIREE